MNGKQRTAAAVYLILAAVAGDALAGANPWDEMAGRFPFKSAIIHYTVEGGQKGEETLYVRDSGREQVHITKTTGRVLFSTVTTNKIMITTRETITDIDLEKKTGIRYTNPMKFSIEEYNKLTPAEQAVVRKNAMEMGANLNNSLLGGIMTVERKADTILGYKCDVVSGMGMKTWSITDTGIPLKQEVTLIGSSVKTATKVDTNAPVPASVFEAPAGIPITADAELDRRNRETAKQVMNMLKDPEFGKKSQSAQQEAPSQDSGGKRSPSGVKDPEITDKQRKEADEAVKKGVDTLKSIFGGGK